MALNEDLGKEVKDIFATSWQEKDGQKVPEAENVKLGNDAVKLQATVLYADLAESTNLVDAYKAWFAPCGSDSPAAVQGWCTWVVASLTG